MGGRPERRNPGAEAEAGPRLRDSRWSRYDEAVADRIVARVAKGAPLPEVLADSDLPGATFVRRWRRRRPEFDAALKTAVLAGHRRRMRTRRRSTPELVDQILAGVARGKSLSQVCEAPGMPHRVTVYNWLRTRPDFARAVEAACEDRDAMLREQALEIAEASTRATTPLARARIGQLRKRIGRMARKPRRD